ncbi:hypothetical protein NSTC731_06573 [Nostoc sp. DSM 114167]|jgi:hypothetical protein
MVKALFKCIDFSPKGLPKNKLSILWGGHMSALNFGRVGTPIPQENLGCFFIWKSAPTMGYFLTGSPLKLRWINP